jgi:hypothetical protein
VPRWDHAASGARVVFRLAEPVDYTASAGAANYRGKPVLESRPDWSQPLELELQRKLAEIDFGTGVRTWDDESGLPATLQRMKWTFAERAELDAFRRLLYALRGRAVSLWVPTWEDDLVVTAPIADTGDAIDVEWAAYTLQLELDPGRRDIRIELVDGTVFYRRITGAQELDASTERLQIDAPLGVTVPAAQVAKICFMTLARLDADAVELAYWTGNVAESATVMRSFRSDV